MNPRFSIIIPVYNVAPYLRECLDSVLAQTFTDWEAICVDDGSTDGSGVILDEYAAKDARFRVIHQKNAGVSAARNVALEVIGGEWFLFLDGDDMLRPDALEHFDLVICNNSCDAVLMQPYCEELDREEAARETAPFRVISRMRNGTHLMTGKISANGFPFGRVYKTSVFQGLRFQIGIGMAEDVLFWSRAVGVPAEWLAVQGSYYYYRLRVGSASRCYDFKHYDQIVKVNLLVLRQLMAYDPTGAAVRGYWRRYRWSCEHVKEVFDCWGRYAVPEQRMLLSYQDGVKAICHGIPFSAQFRFLFWAHRTESRFLVKIVMLAIRAGRNAKFIGKGLLRQMRPCVV